MNTKKFFLLLFIFFQGHIFFDISAMEEDNGNLPQQENVNNIEQPEDNNKPKFFENYTDFFSAGFYPKFKAARWWLFRGRVRHNDVAQSQVDYLNQKDENGNPFKDADGKDRVPKPITPSDIKVVNQGYNVGKNIKDSLEDAVVSGIGTGTGEGFSYLIKKGIDRLIPNQPTPQEMIQNKHNEKESIRKEIAEINQTLTRIDIDEKYKKFLEKKQEKLFHDSDKVDQRLVILEVQNSNDPASLFIKWCAEALPEENENMSNELTELGETTYYQENKDYNIWEILAPIEKYKEDMQGTEVEVYDPGTNKNVIRYKVKNHNDVIEFLTKEQYYKKFPLPVHSDASQSEIEEFFAAPYVKLAKQYINKIHDFDHALYSEGITEKDKNTEKNTLKPHFDIISQSKPTRIRLFKEIYEEDNKNKTENLVTLKTKIEEKTKQDNIGEKSKKLYAILLTDIDKTISQLTRKKVAARNTFGQKLYASSQAERKESMKNGVWQQTQRLAKEHPTATKTIATGILLPLGLFIAKLAIYDAWYNKK